MALIPLSRGQTRQLGEVAANFQLTNVRTGQPFQLSDLEGSIIVLDFFFYW